MLGEYRNRVFTSRLKLGASAFALLTVVGTSTAFAQNGEALETVTVTGYRASLENAIEAKRSSVGMIDQINSEDIGKFPETNLADSMARLPGVQVDRGDTGEARTITVRGLGSDFTLVKINGMDAQTTAGGTNAQTDANRTRGFDFNTFASELFNKLKVEKSASASSEEGSLGAVVELSTGRPLDYDEFKWAVSAQEQMIDTNNSFRPRASALIADQFFGHTLGVMGSIAFSQRGSTDDFYNRNFGQFEYTYRNSQLAGVTPATFGFARPSNAAACTGAGTYLGTGCGSDPAAYAALSPTSVIPVFPTLSHTTVNYTRLGMTGTVEWKPIERFHITADYLYSEYSQDATNYQLTPIGLNRNLYNNTEATNPASLSASAKKGLYPTCATVSYYCIGSTSGITPAATLVPGMLYSTNPYNLDPYDYYNNPASVGYGANPYGINGFNELVGRPNTQVVGAHTVTVNGQTYADMLALNKLDWRDAADGSINKTVFRQANITAEFNFTDRFRVSGFYGQSSSKLNTDGVLVEFNATDKDGFVYDETGGGNMPAITTGFDVANPSNWSIIKGLSSWRHFVRQVNNSFSNMSLDFTYDFTDTMTLKFGASRKVFQNHTYIGQRTATDTIVPTLQEAGLTVQSLGQAVTFGTGLDVPGSTPTGWFAPSITKFDDAFGVRCNCVNKWGDWTTGSDNRANNFVTEKDMAYYVEYSFNENLAGHQVFGNFGVRLANTVEDAMGFIGGSATVAGIGITAHNSYHDLLPSFNIGYELIPDLMLRFAGAKVMTRPQLLNLIAGSTSFSTSMPSSGNPSVTMGNPYLKPFRANNLDASLEWYFNKDGLVSIAVFQKQVGSFPQQLLTSMPLANALGGPSSSAYATVLANITNAGLNAYTAAGGQWDVRQYKDAPGGTIEGIEFTYQQAFTFLPDPLDGLGAQFNFTHLSSKLNYVVNGDKGTLLPAPWLNNSPNAINTTIYYEKGGFQARVSAQYRAGYISQFPLSGGTCEVGLTTNAGGPCNSPIMADFKMVKSDLRLDASTSYDWNENITVTFDVQNITGTTTRNSIYKDVKFAQQYQADGSTFRIGVRVKN